MKADHYGSRLLKDIHNKKAFLKIVYLIYILKIQTWVLISLVLKERNFWVWVMAYTGN